jgi:hypothetical protein
MTLAQPIVGIRVFTDVLERCRSPGLGWLTEAGNTTVVQGDAEGARGDVPNAAGEKHGVKEVGKKTAMCFPSSLAETMSRYAY